MLYVCVSVWFGRKESESYRLMCEMDFEQHKKQDENDLHVRKVVSERVKWTNS